MLSSFQETYAPPDCQCPIDFSRSETGQCLEHPGGESYPDHESLSEAFESTSLYDCSPQPPEDYPTQYADIQQKNRIGYRETSPHFYQGSMTKTYTSSLEMALKYPEELQQRPRSTASCSPGSDRVNASIPSSSITMDNVILSNPQAHNPYPSQHKPESGYGVMSAVHSSSPLAQAASCDNLPTAMEAPMIVDPDPSTQEISHPVPNRILPAYTISPPDVGFGETVSWEQTEPKYGDTNLEQSIVNAVEASPTPTRATPSSWSFLGSGQYASRGSPPLITFPSNLRGKGLRHYASESELCKALGDEAFDASDSQPQSVATVEGGIGAKPKRKSKMHPCPVCGKPFPRVFLRFSWGINPELMGSGSRPEWLVGFEDPQVVPEGGHPSSISPSKFRWMPPFSSREPHVATKSEGDSGSELDEPEDDLTQRYESFEMADTPLRTVVSSESERFGEDVDSGQEMKPYPGYAYLPMSSR